MSKKKEYQVVGEVGDKWVRESDFISAEDMDIGDIVKLTVKSVKMAEFLDAVRRMNTTTGAVLLFEETERAMVVATKKDGKLIGNQKAKAIRKITGSRDLNVVTGKKLTIKCVKMDRPFGGYDRMVTITEIKDK